MCILIITCIWRATAHLKHKILCSLEWPLYTGLSVNTLYHVLMLYDYLITSEAISSRPLIWRFFSFLIIASISGSSSAKGSLPVHKSRRLFLKQTGRLKTYRKNVHKIKKFWTCIYFSRIYIITEDV